MNRAQGFDAAGMGGPSAPADGRELIAVGQNVEGPEPRFVIEDLRSDHQLVRPGLLCEGLQSRPDRLRGAHDGAPQRLVQDRALHRTQALAESCDWRWKASRPTEPEIEKRLLQ